MTVAFSAILRREYLVSIALVIGFVAILLGAMALLPNITSLITQIVAGVLVAIAGAAAVIFAKGFWNKTKAVSKEPKQEKVLKPTEPSFDARIVDKKETYHIHDSVQFWSHYEGNLPNVFFDNEILAPDGKVFPPPYTCKDHSQYWSPDYCTYDPDKNLGKLNGQRNETSNWNFIIESGYPKGVYTVRMRLYYQTHPNYIDTRKHLPEIVDTITVV